MPFPIGVSGSFGIPSSPADFNRDGIVDEWDLQLMNDCMGAIADPNIVRIDTNYDSRVNLPDFGIFSFDYGYTNDPNLPGNHDPNCERSDFTGDHQVDLADLEILTQYWLTPVFDEYRICGLCNIGANDPNDPNEPSTSNIIDSKDYDALMADWHKQIFSDPNISIAQSASQLTVAVGNTGMVWKISAFFDDEPIGQWTAGELGSTAFDVDLMRYGPGSHKVKIVRNIEYGLEITERVITDPNSTGLYFADIPDTFEPNELYNIRGFNLNDNELNFRIGNIQGETVYDVNVPSGPVSLSVPASAFGQSMMAPLAVARTSIASEGGNGYEKILGQKFDREKYRGRWVRFLVLLPDRKVTATFKDAIFAALAAIEKRVPDYPYMVLTRTNVNYENLKFALSQTRGAKIVVFFGHASSYVGGEWINNNENVGGVQRTQFQCYTKREGYFWDSYDNVGMVSYTSRDDPLPNSLDNVVLDFTRLLMGSSSYDFVPIDQMYVFGCRSAAPRITGEQNDMATAQGCGGLHDNAHTDMIYCGFAKKVLQNNADWFFLPQAKELLTYVVQGLVIFFQQLGDGKRVDQARQYVEYSGQVENGIKQALFQKAELTFYGRGYGNVKFGYYEVIK